MRFSSRTRFLRRSSDRGVAGVLGALVAVLIIATPTLAAKPPEAGAGGAGGGNSGDVKVVDAATGADESPSNDPHVCSFYLEFSGSEAGQGGDWWILTWPADGSDPVFAGEYLIGADGTYTTDTMSTDAGHYRVEWQGTNDSTTKHKTFWVDDDCDEEEPIDEPDEEEPTEEPIGEPEESIGSGEGGTDPSLGGPVADELPDSAMAPAGSDALLWVLGLSALIAAQAASPSRRSPGR